MPFLSFSCLVALARTSRTILNRRSESGYVWAFLSLQRAGATLCCGVWASHCSASPVTEHRLWVHRLQSSWHMGSTVAVHRLNCSVACGIFPDQGSSQWPLHARWTLNHWSPEKPLSEFFVVCLPWMICSWSTEMIMWFRPFFLLIWCVTLVFLDVKPILYLLLYFFYMNYKMSFWNFTKFKLIFKLRYLNKHLYGIQTTYPRIWHAFLFPHVFSWVFVF